MSIVFVLILNLLGFELMFTNSHPIESQVINGRLSQLQLIHNVNKEEALGTGIREIKKYSRQNLTGKGKENATIQPTPKIDIKILGTVADNRLNKINVKRTNQLQCGFGNNRRSKAHSKQKRYALLSPQEKWETTDLTYAIRNYNAFNLKTSQIKETIRKAFATWSEVTPLTFTETSSIMANINIQFLSVDIENCLAYAMGPPLGEIHFDSNVMWSVQSSTGEKAMIGYDLLWVAVHELGHALGLDHSQVPGSVMAANYPTYNQDLKLHDDDVQKIQALYGSKRTSSTAPPTEPITDWEHEQYYPPADTIAEIMRRWENRRHDENNRKLLDILLEALYQ